jgi:hypothetical protein
MPDQENVKEPSAHPSNSPLPTSSTAFPPLPGLRIPHDFYWVPGTPAPLAGMKLPRPSPSPQTAKNGIPLPQQLNNATTNNCLPFPWSELAKAGFKYVVALHPAKYDPSPLTLLSTTSLEDLVSGGPPADPENEIRKIKNIVNAIVQKLRSGEGVVVHCWGGRGRTGTVIGCVLCELGYKPAEIIAWLNTIHQERGKPGWPESTWQSELVVEWHN